MLSSPPGPDPSPLPASLPLALLSSHLHALTISSAGSFRRPGGAKKWDLLFFLLLESRPLGCAAGTVLAVLSPFPTPCSRQLFLPGCSAFPGSPACPSLPSSAGDSVVGAGFLGFSSACFPQGTLRAAGAHGTIRDVCPLSDSSSPLAPLAVPTVPAERDAADLQPPPWQSIGVRHPRLGEPFLCGSLCRWWPSLAGARGAQEQERALCEMPSAANVESQVPASPSAWDPLSSLDSSNRCILLELSSSRVSACSSHGRPWQLEMLSRCSVFCSAVGSIPSFTGAQGLLLSSPAPDSSPGLSLRLQSRSFLFHIRNSAVVSSPISFQSLSLSSLCVPGEVIAPLDP